MIEAIKKYTGIDFDEVHTLEEAVAKLTTLILKLMILEAKLLMPCLKSM